MICVLCIPVKHPAENEHYPEILWVDSISEGNVFDDWKVVKTLLFQPVQLPNELPSMAVAYVAKDELPPQDEWFGYGEEEAAAIEVFASSPGQTITYGFLYTGELPELGQPVIIGGEPIEDGENPRLRLIYSDYASQRIDSYSPVSESPFLAAYMVWCEQTPVPA